MAEEKGEVIIDLRGALLKIERKTKVKMTAESVSKKHGVKSTVSFRKWESEAPLAVRFIHDFLKDNPELSFSDLVKRV